MGKLKKKKKKKKKNNNIECNFTSVCLYARMSVCVCIWRQFCWRLIAFNRPTGENKTYPRCIHLKQKVFLVQFFVLIRSFCIVCCKCMQQRVVSYRGIRDECISGSVARVQDATDDNLFLEKHSVRLFRSYVLFHVLSETVLQF